MEPRFYEDFGVGDKFRSRGRTVTQTDKVNFLNLARITEELFANKEYYETQGLFKKEIVPGPLTFAIAAGLLQSIGLFEGTVLAFLGADELRFPKPVCCEDTLHMEIEVLRKRQKHPDRGIIAFKETVTNQNHEIVMSYIHTLVFRCKGTQA